MPQSKNISGLAAGMSFPHLDSFVDEALDKGWHSHIQVFVYRDNVIRADLSFAATNCGFGSHTLFPLMCAAKPLLSFALISACLDKGWPIQTKLADVDRRLDPRCRGLRILDVLTHQTGLPPLSTESVRPDRDWMSCVDSISSDAEESVISEPGGTACYQEVRFWFLLGEVLSKVTGLSTPDALREWVTALLGESNDGLDQEFAFGDELLDVRDTVSPMRNLAAFDWIGDLRDDLQRGWRGGITTFASARALGTIMRSAFANMRRVENGLYPWDRWRSGSVDQYFGCIRDWGLGLMLESSAWGRESTVFCSEASGESFGHTSRRSVATLIDPARALCISVAADGDLNGMANAFFVRHLFSAVYKALNISAMADDQRDEST